MTKSFGSVRAVDDVSLQAQLLGHRGITPASLHAKAMCDKHGPDVADVGPGSDWFCLMGWTDPNVPITGARGCAGSVAIARAAPPSGRCRTS